MKDYHAVLKDGQEIYIAQWSASVAYQNLTQVCKAFGPARVEAIAKLDEHSMANARASFMDGEDGKLLYDAMSHFVCTVGMDGKRILPNTFDAMFSEDINVPLEIFTHVVHAVYAKFFGHGSVEDSSLAS
tara:strand:- start:1988 stop:2377 length:390 start_codon:yes stop_codon:yes gene_type:complete